MLEHSPRLLVELRHKFSGKHPHLDRPLFRVKLRLQGKRPQRLTVKRLWLAEHSLRLLVEFRRKCPGKLRLQAKHPHLDRPLLRVKLRLQGKLPHLGKHQ